MAQTLMCVLPTSRERQLAVPEGIRVRLLCRLGAPRQNRPRCQSHAAQGG